MEIRQKLKMPLIAVCLCLTGTGGAYAQWVVSDPGNLAQSIINMSDNIAHTSKTVETAGTKANTLNGFLETKKVFEQGKAYYDALKSVHDVVRGGTKVAKSVGLVMEISETYVDNYQKMLSDENYTPEELKLVLDIEKYLAHVQAAYFTERNYRNLVRYYTNKTISVSYLRARKKNDMDRVTALYGNPNEKYW